MDSDRDDPILDACLDEILGGKSPPDLAQRILRAWPALANSEATATSVALPVIPSHIDEELIPEAPPIVAAIPRVIVASGSRPGVTRRVQQSTQGGSLQKLTVGLAAGILGLGLAIGIVALVRFNKSPIAKVPVTAPDKVIVNSNEPSKSIDPPAPNEPSAPILPPPQLAQQSSEPPATLPAVPEAPEPIVPKTSNSFASTLAAAPPRQYSPRQYPPPSPDRQIVSFVNTQLAKTWNEAGVKPTPAITEAQWCRRLFNRVLGRAPTEEEQRTFADDKSPNRREKLVEQVLLDPGLSEEYARRWSSVLTNVFAGRRGAAPGSVAARDELQKYFVTALSTDKPYNQMATELLTASGGSRPGDADYNPAVNFLIDGHAPDATFTTARVSRVLLGQQLQCAQCHQHPTQDWSPEQFWSLNACFRNLRIVSSSGGQRLIIDDTARGADYTTADGVMKTATPRFLDGTDLSNDGNVRNELARVLVESDDFSKAAVNRIWAILFDYGFTRPVHDLGPNSSPSAPQVLDRLATEFAAHGFDIKAPIRWAVLSEPFSRSSTITDLASKDMPEEGEPALFSRFYTRPPQAPQAIGALAQAVQIRRRGGSASDMQQARIDWLTQANKAPTKGPPKGPSKGPGKLGGKGPGPAVMARPGNVTHRAVSGDPTGMVKRLAASSLPFEQQVEHLFLIALARSPAPAERRAAQELLAASQDNPSSALEDTWWALLNSSECLLDR